MPGAHFVLVRHGEARAGVDHVVGGERGVRLRPANTSLTAFVASSPHPPWLLDRYNHDAHLRSL